MTQTHAYVVAQNVAGIDLAQVINSHVKDGFDLHSVVAQPWGEAVYTLVFKYTPKGKR